MEFSDLKKYIFHFQGGYRVATKAGGCSMSDELELARAVGVLEEEAGLRITLADVAAGLGLTLVAWVGLVAWILIGQML